MVSPVLARAPDRLRHCLTVVIENQLAYNVSLELHNAPRTWILAMYSLLNATHTKTDRVKYQIHILIFLFNFEHSTMNVLRWYVLHFWTICNCGPHSVQNSKKRIIMIERKTIVSRVLQV